MTDTTDVAALRSKAANVIGLLTAESLTGGFALDSLADVFDDMFRLLEAERHKGDLWFGKVADLEAALKAERQQRKAAEKEREGLQKALVIYGDEILELRAKLKVEQVPVDDLQAEIKALMRTYALVSSPSTMEAAHEAGYAFVKAKGFNRILAALFTAPQMPVVLPKEIDPREVIDILDPTANPEDYACCVGADMYNAAIKASRAAIEAAGGIVKDGE